MKTRDEVQALIDETKCEPFQFYLGAMAGGWYLQARLWRDDTDTGEKGWGHGAKYYISPHMTAGEIVKKCFVAARDFAEHEVREAFMWRGRRILGPHIPIESLWEVADLVEVRE